MLLGTVSADLPEDWILLWRIRSMVVGSTVTNQKDVALKHLCMEICVPSAVHRFVRPHVGNDILQVRLCKFFSILDCS